MIMNKEKDDSIIQLCNIPPFKGRYIAFDTETTGLSYSRDHIISLAAVEIVNGRLTGVEFQGYLSPRVYISEEAIKVHQLDNNFYNEYFTDTYESDRQVLINFSNFIGDSLIFAHNALFDYNFLFKEMKYYGLPSIEKKRFRCTMKIFKNVFAEVDPTLKSKNSLVNCCKYLGIKGLNESFHSALFDSFMCAKLIIFILNLIEKNSSKNLNNGKFHSLKINKEIEKKENNKDDYNKMERENEKENDKSLINKSILPISDRSQEKENILDIEEILNNEINMINLNKNNDDRENYHNNNEFDNIEELIENLEEFGKILNRQTFTKSKNTSNSIETKDTSVIRKFFFNFNR